mmetsp:Transcript_32694/g.39571  ORF Transcript_32694/g.39571 Transcript_32694/m.39571 type:complete len:93 (-) Transcript_32694:184-462(-)
MSELRRLQHVATRQLAEPDYLSLCVLAVQKVLDLDSQFEEMMLNVVPPWSSVVRTLTDKDATIASDLLDSSCYGAVGRDPLTTGPKPQLEPM